MSIYKIKNPSEINPQILISVFNDFVFVFKHTEGQHFPHLFVFTRNDHSKNKTNAKAVSYHAGTQ